MCNEVDFKCQLEQEWKNNPTKNYYNINYVSPLPAAMSTKTNAWHRTIAVKVGMSMCVSLCVCVSVCMSVRKVFCWQRTRRWFRSHCERVTKKFVIVNRPIRYRREMDEYFPGSWIHFSIFFLIVTRKYFRLSIENDIPFSFIAIQRACYIQ